MIGFEDIPLSTLLKERQIYRTFDEEFLSAKGRLNAAVLLSSESTLKDLYKDKTVPSQVLDKIVERLQKM